MSEVSPLKKKTHQRQGENARNVDVPCNIQLPFFLFFFFPFASFHFLPFPPPSSVLGTLRDRLPLLFGSDMVPETSPSLPSHPPVKITDVKGSPTTAPSLSHPSVAPNYRPRHPSEGRLSFPCRRGSRRRKREVLKCDKNKSGRAKWLRPASSDERCHEHIAHPVITARPVPSGRPDLTCRSSPSRGS